MSELQSQTGVVLAGPVGLGLRELFVEAFFHRQRRLALGAARVTAGVPALDDPGLAVERRPTIRHVGRGIGCRIAG